MRNLIKKIYLAGIILSPVLVLAQGGVTDIDSGITQISTWINSIILLLIGIGVLVFIYGLIKYLTSGGDEEKRKAAIGTIVWGIIILFVMVSVWGLVNLLDRSFGLTDTTPTGIPEVPRN